MNKGITCQKDRKDPRWQIPPHKMKSIGYWDLPEGRMSCRKISIYKSCLFMTIECR